MVRQSRRDFDDADHDAMPIRKKPTGAGSTGLLIGLLAGGLSLVLLTGCCGLGMVGAVLRWDNVGRANRARDAAERNVVEDEVAKKKFVGAWKGRFNLGPGPTDHLYVFEANGRFREEAFDLTGRRLHVSPGQWSLQDGEVWIDWDNGSFESAIVSWIDDRTMDYSIVEHNDARQIGLGTRFRRQ